MEVNEFVYDPHGHSNSSLMSLTKGTFAFIAGEVAHSGSMKVNTPVGTMGIRGTAPHVEILNDGSVKFSTPHKHNSLRWQPLARSPRPSARGFQLRQA
jgi:hypothetical protein